MHLPVVWTMVFMLWNVFTNSEDLASDPYSSTWTNATLLSWFLNVVTINFMMSRGGRFLLDGNPKVYEVKEHIATKVDVNIWMLKKIQNAKYIWSMNPGANLETSVVGPMGILDSLVNRQIWHGSSKSRWFSGITPTSTFLAIHFIPAIGKQPKRWRISWESFF